MKPETVVFEVIPNIARKSLTRKDPTLNCSGSWFNFPLCFLHKLFLLNKCISQTKIICKNEIWRSLKIHLEIKVKKSIYKRFAFIKNLNVLHIFEIKIFSRQGIFFNSVSKNIFKLTDTGEDSKLVYRRKRSKVNAAPSPYFLLFFRRVRATSMTQCRVENTRAYF